MKKSTPRTAAVAMAALTAGSLAATSALAGPTVNLSANVKSTLPNDEMIVQLAIERSGNDVGSLNDAVLAALNESIAQAKVVRGVTPRLGSIYTNQQYNPQGRPQGWTVRGEMVLEGKDMKATGELAGKLSQRLQIAGVSFRLSDAKRQQEEQRLLKEAASVFAARAQDSASAFGFKAFEYKHMTINTSGAAVTVPRPMMAMARGAAMDASVPTEGGDSQVQVGISGAIELK